MNVKCDRCRTLTFREPDREIPSHFGLQGIPRLVYVLHYTKESWSRSIAAGCHFCTLVRGQVYSCETPNKICDELGAYVVLALTLWDEIENLPEYFEPMRISIISRLGVSQLKAIEDLPGSYLAALDSHIRSFPRHAVGPPVDNNHQPIIHSSTPPQRQYPLFHLQLASLWRDECLNKHVRCRDAGNTGKHRLPTRLIDVTDPDHPILQDAAAVAQQGADIRYVALSYCWGSGKKFLTLRENYISFKTDGILAGDLPRTFKDAIYTSHLMGYRYLWIDAICIIQNDPGDLQHELRFMGEIYRYAALTICAQGAASSHSGLFQSSRQPLSLLPCNVELAILAPESEPGTVVLNRTLAGTLYVTDYLTSRGWILQEDILSSCALRFADQMSWRCMEAFRMETEPSFSRPTDLLPSSVQGTFAPTPHFFDPLKFIRGWLYVDCGTNLPTPGPRLPASELLEQDVIPSQSNMFSAWYNMVQIYSDKQLSFESDILRALSGISAIFRDTHRTTYLAGLWKEDLCTGLCWYVGANDARQATRCLSDRHSLPSWTWASVGKVRVYFACLSRSGDKSFLSCKPGQNGQVVLDAFCTWDDPINEATLDLLRGSIPAGRFPGQLWSLRIKAKAKLAVLRRNSRYTEWRMKRHTSARDSEDEGRSALKTPQGIYPRFPGLLLDEEDTNVVLGEAAVDFGEDPGSSAAKISPSTSGESRPQNEFVKRGADAAALEKKDGDDLCYQEDMEVMCLLLDPYRFLTTWYDVCLVVVPRRKGSTSFSRVGLGFLTREVKHEYAGRAGWEMMDCEIV